MILETAVLQVEGGRTADFEAALAEAASIIASMPGFLGREVLRSPDVVGRYLLPVRWETREHHTEGFRGSPEYARWKALFHHFYDPVPTVEYNEPLDR